MTEERENVDGGIPEKDADSTDMLLRLCGDTGVWQLKVFLIAAVAGFPSALQDFIYIFIAAPPDDYHCEIPSCFSESYSFLKNLTIPMEKSETEWIHSQCRHYYWNPENCTLEDINLNRTESCTSYTFFSSTMSSTIITEWKQVCGQEFWTSTSQAVYALGSLTGSLIFGMISDKFGRKRAVIISLLISILMSPVVAFAGSYKIFLFARYFLAVGSPAIYDISYILTLEMIGDKWRGLAGNAFGIPYALGYSGTALFAYYIKNWRSLQLAITSVPLVFIVFFIAIVPESPRWLIISGKAEKAELVLRRIAAGNGKTLPLNFSEIVQASCPKKKEDNNEKSCLRGLKDLLVNFAHLVRTPKMRKRTLVLNFTWFSTVLVYYGVALNAPNFSANLYIYTVLSGLLEIPSYLIVPPLIKYFGRRFVFSALLFLSALFLGGTVFMPKGSAGIVTLALIGMFHIGAAYALIFLYGLELLPTVLRSYGIGLAAVSGKIGNAAAPYIASLVGAKDSHYPSIVFVVVSLLASFVSLWLPETKGKPIPETIEDIEND